jgi:hypothetical protein
MLLRDSQHDLISSRSETEDEADSDAQPQAASGSGSALPLRSSIRKKRVKKTDEELTICVSYVAMI